MGSGSEVSTITGVARFTKLFEEVQGEQRLGNSANHETGISAAIEFPDNSNVGTNSTVCIFTSTIST